MPCSYKSSAGVKPVESRAVDIYYEKRARSLHLHEGSLILIPKKEFARRERYVVPHSHLG
jgi:hypothetical protein